MNPLSKVKEHETLQAILSGLAMVKCVFIWPKSIEASLVSAVGATTVFYVFPWSFALNIRHRINTLDWITFPSLAGLQRHNLKGALANLNKCVNYSSGSSLSPEIQLEMSCSESEQTCATLAVVVP